MKRKSKLDNMTVFADLEFIAFCLLEMGKEAKRIKSKTLLSKSVAASVSVYHIAGMLGFDLASISGTPIANATQHRLKKTKT